MQEFARERGELGWYYAGLGPMLGMRAAPLERSGGWNCDGSSAMHDQRIRATRDVAKLRRVDAALALLPASVREDLAAAFEPFGAARVSTKALSQFTVAGQCLFGLALRTRAAAEFAEGETDTGVLRFVLDDAVRRVSSVNGGRLGAVLDETRGRFQVALLAYSKARRASQTGTEMLAAIDQAERVARAS